MSHVTHLDGKPRFLLPPWYIVVQVGDRDNEEIVLSAAAKATLSSIRRSRRINADRADAEVLKGAMTIMS